jgi:hypothetical protein
MALLTSWEVGSAAIVVISYRIEEYNLEFSAYCSLIKYADIWVFVALIQLAKWT